MPEVPNIEFRPPEAPSTEFQPSEAPSIEFRPPKAPKKKRGPLDQRMAKLHRVGRVCAGHPTRPDVAHVICAGTAQTIVTYRKPGEDEPITDQLCTAHRKEVIKAGWEITEVKVLGPLGPVPPGSTYLGEGV